MGRPPRQPLDVECIRRAFGGRVEYFRELESTNSHALGLARDDAVVLPYLVIAESQTAGRGRGENRWWAGDGALAFSLLMDAEQAAFERAPLPPVSLVAGLAVSDALETFLPGAKLRVKWPNDVYLDGRKVCGILVELSTAPQARMVIGIGVNVNNRLDSAPPELRETATSMWDVAGCAFDRTRVLVSVLDALPRRLEQIRREPEALPEVWRERCFLEGRTVSVRTGSRLEVGICHGIDERGALLLAGEGGVQRCVAGVVERIV